MGRKKKTTLKREKSDEEKQLEARRRHRCYHCQWARWADDGHISCFWRRCEKAAGINTKSNTPAPAWSIKNE